MKERERDHHGPRGQQPLAGGASPGSSTVDQRAMAERLLAHGADVIGRALSSDSTAFLAANRQEGGQ